MKKFFLLLFFLPIITLAQNTLRRDLWRQDHDTSISRLPYIRIGTLLLPGALPPGMEIDPVFAADSAAIVHWADTNVVSGVGIATAFDISALGGGGWTVLSGTPDTIYENDSAVVKLNNWLMTDYITDGSKVDDEEGLPLNVGNTMLGYGAFVKYSRLGDMAQLSTFIGYQAGYDADTVAYSTFLGLSAGQESTNATGSTFLGINAGSASNYADDSTCLGIYAGESSTNADYSTFLGNRAGRKSTNATGSTFIGYSAGYQSDSATGSTFLGNSAGELSTNATGSTFLGNRAGRESTYATGSTFLGVDAGSASNYADYSTFLGLSAGESSTNATNSTFLGNKAGYQSDSISDSYFYGSYTGIKSNLLDEMILIGESVGYQQSGLSHQIWIDDSPTSTPLILGDFANDVLTVNGIVEIPGDGTPKFRLYVIADTLCSVRVGIDTVRIHPPR